MKFGNFKAVDSLSLSVRRNEIMAVLGHNGAGKTTAIYMLTGMLHMSEGEALINGRSVKHNIEEVRQNIGLCQQLDVLFNDLSVREHLVLTYRIRKGAVSQTEMNAQIDEILTMTQMTEHKDKLVKQCSGGMKRKLSLGMALIGETQTIILDEPTSGLDVESREQMWALIRTLKENRSIIMSTQHIEEADELADRVCIMSHGRVIGLDTPEGIKHDFGVGYNVFVEAKHQYESQLNEAGLKAIFDRVRAIFIGREDLAGIEESQDSNYKKLIITVPSTYVHKLSALIEQVEQTVPEASIDIEQNSLEDAFIKIAESDIKQEEAKIKEMAQ
jgi:ATP-binding cassette subfamily A (ABC1) protein 3